MSKIKCPNCEKKFVNAEYLKVHANDAHPDRFEDKDKRKGWMTPSGFVDFSYPVSYAEACNQMELISQKMFGKEKNQ